MRGPSGPVLGLDAATPRGGVALVDADGTATEVAFDRPDSPSRLLLPAIRDLLAQRSLELADLAGLAVTVGPGSFTGIRVGLATARGLAMAGDCPVAGVSTLRAMALAAGKGEPVIATWLDAGRGEIYAGLFLCATTGAAPVPGGDEQVARAETVLATLPAGPVRFVGPGAGRNAALIESRPRRDPGDSLDGSAACLAAATARLGRLDLAAGATLPMRPRYLRAPDALRSRA